MSDDLDNPCAAPWCCLTCSARFRVGKVRLVMVSERHPVGFACPVCRSGDLQPADGQTVVLDAYHGEKGTLQ